jgi:hypothetical protein
MMKKLLTNRPLISVILFAQLIPLLAFSPEAYDLSGQVWWLPAFLAILVLLAAFQLVVRGTYASWPWYLIGFANGFNIISRLMMFFPHIMINISGTQTVNWPYIIISLLAMVLSSVMLWFVEFPEVKNIMIKS